MSYELISAAELRGLPEDNDEAFVEAEVICRRNLTQLLQEDETQHGNAQEDIRLQYMATISALAADFGITGLEYPDDGRGDALAYRAFARQAQAQVARIIARNRGARQASSVLLTTKTRMRIEQQIAVLRQIIEASNLPDLRKAKLYATLDEMLVELASGRRLTFAITMQTLIVIATAIGGTGGAVSGVAEAPVALTNIMQWIGQDKETEDAAVLRLAAPQLALPAPPVAKPQAPSKPTVHTRPPAHTYVR
jgi:hypothetical protein